MPIKTIEIAAHKRDSMTIYTFNKSQVYKSIYRQSADVHAGNIGDLEVK